MAITVNEAINEMSPDGVKDTVLYGLSRLSQENVRKVLVSYCRQNNVTPAEVFPEEREVLSPPSPDDLTDEG